MTKATRFKKAAALALAAVIAAAALLAGCSSANQKVLKAGITDAAGNVITFDKPVEKIVSLLPSDTEVLYALGVQDKIIGVATICQYPEDVKNKTQLDTFDKTNVESIIALQPDVVFMGKMTQSQDQLAQLQAAGIKIVIDEPQTIEEIYTTIDRIATIVNKQKEAADLIAGMRADFETLKAEAKTLASKSVYVEISPVEFGIWTPGKGTFLNEIIEMLGMTNIFADLTGWNEVSEEQVIKRDPDVIISTVGKNYQSGDSVAEIKGRANWKNMTAVKAGKVYWIDGDKISIPGPRLVESTRELLDLLKK